MLEERFTDIREIILATSEFFDIRYQVPEELPDEWLKAFQEKQLVLKIGEHHLLARSYLGDEIRVELDSGIASSEKERWQLKMKELQLKDFSFSTFGVILRSDKVFDLIASTAKTEDVSQEKTEEGGVGESELVKPKKCPSCRHKLSEEEVENGLCDECKENFWICPRCDALITEDPDEAENCPICKKNYKTIECPECRKDIWVDETKCPNCGEELKISKCPDCQKKFVMTDELEDCPYCGENIYICPRCREYIDENPDDINFCPFCKKSLVTIDCPNCSEDVFSDSERCEHCEEEFKLGKCPNSDCEKLLILSNSITECPYCENNIQYASCPRCQEKFYIEVE